jgi:hypothetical protein
MSKERDTVLDFIIAREGEVEGLQSLTSVINKRINDQSQNTHTVQKSASSTVAVLERILTSIDVTLLNLNLQNSENVIADAFKALSSVRQVVHREMSSEFRAVGNEEGRLQGLQETNVALQEKTSSAESTVRNQKALLEKIATGESPGIRTVGEKPIPMKDQRKFQSMINDDNQSLNSQNESE